MPAPNGAAQRIRTMFSAWAGAPLRPPQIAALVGWNGGMKTIYNALSHLERRGEIECVGRALYRRKRKPLRLYVV